MPAYKLSTQATPGNPSHQQQRGKAWVSVRAQNIKCHLWARTNFSPNDGAEASWMMKDLINNALGHFHRGNLCLTDFSWKTWVCLQLQKLSKNIGRRGLGKWKQFGNIQSNNLAIRAVSKLDLLRRSQGYQSRPSSPVLFLLLNVSSVKSVESPDILTFPSIVPYGGDPSTQNWDENELSLLDQFITRDLLRRAAPGGSGTLNITSSTSTGRQTFVNIFQFFLFLFLPGSVAYERTFCGHAMFRTVPGGWGVEHHGGASRESASAGSRKHGTWLLPFAPFQPPPVPWMQN